MFDVFEEIFIVEGEWVVMFEVIVRVVGVFKGGLLYYFGLKEEFEGGFFECFDYFMILDFECMMVVEEGFVVYYVCIFVMEDDVFDWVFIVVIWFV